MTTEEFQEEAQTLRPSLTMQAHRYLTDADDAEDAVQEALLRLWNIHFELRTPMDKMARVVLKNVCYDAIRRRKMLAVRTADNEAGVPLPTTEDDLQAQHMHEGVERMMSIVEQLPDLQQTILRLRHMEGMDYGEMAALVGSTETALRKALSRARQTVKELYLKREKDERH